MIDDMFIPEKNISLNSLINKFEPLRFLLISYQKNFTDKKYSVLYSGHGSDFRFDGIHLDKPSFPLLTLEEATENAYHWEGHADTIGGKAEIFDASSGKKLNVYDYAKQDWVNGRTVFDPENKLPSPARKWALGIEELERVESKFENYKTLSHKKYKH